MTPAQKNGSFLFSQNDTRSRVEPTSQVRPSGDVAVIVVIGAHTYRPFVARRSEQALGRRKARDAPVLDRIAGCGGDM